jgi:hypothetical protein
MGSTKGDRALNDILEKMLKMERVLADFRIDMAKSYGWWFSRPKYEQEDHCAKWEQPFPVSNRTVIEFREGLLDLITFCEDIVPPILHSHLHGWLFPSGRFTGDKTVDVLNFLFQFQNDTVDPIQPALLMGMEQLLRLSTDEIRKSIDYILLTEMSAEGAKIDS